MRPLSKAQKVGKNAFAQLLLSADQPLQTNPRKEGIRIQNAIPQCLKKTTAGIALSGIGNCIG
nr:hypothetical protein [uncultured Fluviicola sp.]